MGWVCSTYLHVSTYFRLSLLQKQVVQDSHILWNMWDLPEYMSNSKIKFLKELHITFLWRSCQSVEKTKLPGCEEQSTAVRGDNSRAFDCTCDSDLCNSQDPESIQPVNPRIVSYRTITQSETISPTSSSTSTQNISNTNGTSTEIKVDVGLKTGPSATTDATKLVNGSDKSKAKPGNTGAVQQGNNGNFLLPHQFLVYLSTVFVTQFWILQWLVLWESFCLCLD